MLYGPPRSPVIQARRRLLVMPETANSQTARQPARACTRGSAKRMAGTLRPASSQVGCAIRSMTGFARMPLPWPAITASISRALHARALADSSSRCPRPRLQPSYRGH